MLVDSQEKGTARGNTSAEMVVSGAEKMNKTVKNTSIWNSQRALGEE